MDLYVNEYYTISVTVIANKLRNDYLHLARADDKYYDAVMVEKGGRVIFAGLSGDKMAFVYNTNGERFKVHKSDLEEIKEKRFELHGTYFESDLKKLLGIIT